MVGKIELEGSDVGEICYDEDIKGCILTLDKRTWTRVRPKVRT
jgi:hypothetical protein